MSKKEVKIENMNRLCMLMDSLVTSGYDLHITPVYKELSEEEKKRAERHNYTPIPRHDHYLVEIGDKHGIDDCARDDEF